MSVLCGLETSMFGTACDAYVIGDKLPIRTYANAYPENMYVFGKVGETYRLVTIEVGVVVKVDDIRLFDEVIELDYDAFDLSGDCYRFSTSDILLEYMMYEDVYDTYYFTKHFGSLSENLMTDEVDVEKRYVVDSVLYKALFELGERYAEMYMIEGVYRNSLIGDILDVTNRFISMEETDEAFEESGNDFVLSMRAYRSTVDCFDRGSIKFKQDIDHYVNWDRDHFCNFKDRDDVLKSLKSMLDVAFDRLSRNRVAKSIEDEIFDLFG